MRRAINGVSATCLLRQTNAPTPDPGHLRQAAESETGAALGSSVGPVAASAGGIAAGSPLRSPQRSPAADLTLRGLLNRPLTVDGIFRRFDRSLATLFNLGRQERGAPFHFPRPRARTV